MAYMFKEVFLPKASVGFKPTTSAYYCLLLMLVNNLYNLIRRDTDGQISSIFTFLFIYTYYINVIFLALEFLFKEFFHT